MARKSTRPNTAHTTAQVQGIQSLRSSGAAGVHSDQNTRRNAAGGRTNRVGSRSAARRAAVSYGY
jgi:hypothetical protein